MAGNNGTQGGPGNRYRVLIVDDAADLRLMLRLQLEGSGQFEVVGEAEDGAEGIELARERQPDLILLDIAMPVRDGFEALPTLRTESPNSRIIILSSFQEAQLGRKALDLGAAAYLEKTVAPDELADRLVELMGSPQPD